MKKHRSKGPDEGFSLFEVLISLALFSLFAGSVMTCVTDFIRRMTVTKVRTEAVAVANRKFDELRALSTDTLPSSGTVGPENISGGGRTFQVYTTYCADVSLCPTTRTRHITIDVTSKGASVFNAETVFTWLR